MAKLQCKYCGSTNVTRVDDTFGATFDCVAHDGTYGCMDCYEKIKDKSSCLEAFLIDYLELCKRHDIYLLNWGECRGPALYPETKDFFGDLFEDVSLIKGGTVRRLKEKMSKDRLESTDNEEHTSSNKE
jgi:hypothetical protein